MRAWEFISEHRLEWTRRKVTARGGKPVMKWRCTSGPRKGRIVPRVSDCSAFIDDKKREKLKTTRSRTQKMQARRANRAKKINTASRLIKKLNKFRKIK